MNQGGCLEGSCHIDQLQKYGKGKRVSQHRAPKKKACGKEGKGPSLRKRQGEHLSLLETFGECQGETRVTVGGGKAGKPKSWRVYLIAWRTPIGKAKR